MGESRYLEVKIVKWKRVCYASESNIMHFFCRQEETCSKTWGQHSTSMVNDNCNLNELLAELNLFKEKNILMEKELKDMEERYSEISLRFAEVEGERQQLVMTVRNLKISKKS